MPETYNKIYKSMSDLEAADIRSIYDKFNSPFAEFDQYAYHSERLRHHFMKQKRRFPLLHRNGVNYWVSAGSEQLQRADVKRFPHFGVYKDSTV